jgi:hypothetical protein
MQQHILRRLLRSLRVFGSTLHVDALNDDVRIVDVPFFLI